MSIIEDAGRRVFLAKAGGALLVAAAGRPARGKEQKELKVSPGEDLMREHGVLRRVLLVYDEAVQRLAGAEAPPFQVIGAGAALIRRVIEDYHEKLEEDFLFPRFEKAGKLTQLVAVLRQQHQAGRAVTAEIMKLTSGPHGAADRLRLADRLQVFTRMYRPHASREDTVLFPAFHTLVGDKEYGELGERFEEQETRVLGEGGFEKAVAEVAQLETALGINDLARFTPRS